MNNTNVVRIFVDEADEEFYHFAAFSLPHRLLYKWNSWWNFYVLYKYADDLAFGGLLYNGDVTEEVAYYKLCDCSTDLLPGSAIEPTSSKAKEVST